MVRVDAGVELVGREGIFGAVLGYFRGVGEFDGLGGPLGALR